MKFDHLWGFLIIAQDGSMVKSLLTELMTCLFLLLVKLQHKRLILVDEAWLNQLFLPLSYRATEPHMLSQVY